MKMSGTCLAALLLGAMQASAADAPPPGTSPQQAPLTPGGLVGIGSPALGAPGGLAGAAATPANPIQLSAYFILNGSWTQEDAQFLAVGRNNGFTLGEARLELTGRPADTLWLFLSIDGAVPLRQGDDLLASSRQVALKDAYGVWAPLRHLRIQAGQFKAPQNIEGLLEETEIKFATRSIVTDGVHPPVGYDAAGLGLDRQLGIAIGTDRIAFGHGGFAAQVAVTNGNGPNQYVNDTQLPSVIGRAALDLFGSLSLGVDGYINPRAVGTQPNLFRENDLGVGGDLRFEARGLHLLLLAQYKSVVRVTSGLPDDSALGLSGEVAYRLGFFEPAVRVSYLDPSSTVVATPGGPPLEAITWYTAGFNLYAPGPGAGRLSLDFTHRDEQAGRVLDNDGLDLSLQVRF